MKLYIPTCNYCGSHKYSSLSCNDNKYTMECLVCENKTTGELQVIDRKFPTVVFPDGKIIKELNTEMELFFEEENDYPFGVNVFVFGSDLTNVGDYEVCNITEFHYLFNSIKGDEQVALESCIHYHGRTSPLNRINFIKIVKAKKKHLSYYNDAHEALHKLRSLAGKIILPAMEILPETYDKVIDSYTEYCEEIFNQ